MEKNIDPASRNYSFEDIEVDERFIQLKKEWGVTVTVFVVHVILLVTNLYTLGADPSTYTYVFGLPLWLFLQLCEFVVYLSAIFFVVDHVYQDMDVDAIGGIIPRVKK